LLTRDLREVADGSDAGLCKFAVGEQEKKRWLKGGKHPVEENSTKLDSLIAFTVR
jgi:hypothetical protein